MSEQPAQPDAAVTVRTIRDLDGISSVREAWSAFQTHPRSDVGTYLEVVARQPEFVRPHVLVLERAGRAIGLVAGSVLRDKLAWRVGSLTVARSRARVLRVETGGAMGESSAEVARAITAELLAALGRREADAVYFHNLDVDSALLPALERAPWLARDRWNRRVGGWVLELPETFEAYLAGRSKSVRKSLERHSRALEKELGADLAIVCHRAPGDLDRLIGDSVAVARLTYQHQMGVGFEDKPSVRRFFAHAMAAGWMRGYVLYAKERPIAFWHALAYGKTLFTRDTGFDPASGELRPGQYLLSKMVAEHCRTRDTERFDFGIMDLEYKRQLGTERYERSSVHLFSRRPRGLLLSALRTATGLADRAARRVLGSRARHWSRRLGALGGRPPGAPDEAAPDGEAGSDRGSAARPG